MKVYDVPKEHAAAGRPLRLAVYGSCRIYDAFESLVTANEIHRVWANDQSNSHTLAEAQQMLDHYLGNQPIPAPVQPFVFNDVQAVPPWTPDLAQLLRRVDAYVFEISELHQVRYRHHALQILLFMRHFVSKFGNAVLPWYRVLSRGLPVGEELVQQVLSSLPPLPAAERALAESLLRETRLEKIDAALATRAIRKLVATSPRRWLFVSHFLVPGLDSSQMQQRAQLRDALAQATAACGVEFFDPSDIVERHGRATALANGGADIFHYNPEFQDQIAVALIGRLRGAPATATGKPRGQPQAARSLPAVAASLNDSLIELHRRRVQRLGVDGSGLHAHYALLLDRGDIVGSRDIAMVDLLLRYLPEHDSYHVLRAGLGEMALLLAAFGRATVAYDPFPERIAALMAGTKHLKASGFPLAGGFAIVPGIVGDGVRGKRTIAVATRLAAVTLSAAQEEAVLKKLESYDAILFDPGSLIRPRPEFKDRAALVDRFIRAGFSHVRDFPGSQAFYCART